MKKFLLFVSTIFLSLLLVNNNAYAQEYPDFLMKLDYFGAEYDDEYTNTYEYSVYYLINSAIDPTTISENDYYLVTNLKVPFRKSTNRDMFSYEVIDILAGPSFTRFQVRITLLKTFVHQNYSSPYDLITTTFFEDNMGFYLRYFDDIDLPGPGYQAGYDDGYDIGYHEGYNEGYDDGYNDFNVADYFGTQNIAKNPYIDYGTASDAFEPTTAIVLINKGYGAPNIVLDKSYLIIIIKKNIYNHVVVIFDDYSPIYHYEATYHDIGDYDIYVFDFSDRINKKYELEIRKENVTTSEQLNQFLNDVKDNLYFSHATKLLNSSIASQFYHFGYLVGLEENITDSDAYRIGYDTGYDRGYNEGHEGGYEQGFEDGYEQGFDYGKTVEYEHGYEDGYNDGYNEGIKEPFYSNFHVWIVPAIIIVVIAGIFVGYRRERHWND